jgi:hypothetical protein
VALALTGCDVNQSGAAYEETAYEPPDPGDVARCEDPSLDWKSGRKTYYNSYPDPDSEECLEYNGCYWEGLFAGCSGKRPEAWVAETDIVAVYPMFEALVHHELCIRDPQSGRVLVVNVIDTCNDADCNGCCTQNQANFDALIDLEFYTNERWGLPDGELQWADLGPRDQPICQ